VGNLGSVLRALEELRVAPVLVKRAAGMLATDGLILPGVGNFADCAHPLGWTTALRDAVQGHKRPLQGACVGMRLLAIKVDKQRAVDAVCQAFVPVGAR
jgi:glutamine amidotransferase